MYIYIASHRFPPVNNVMPSMLGIYIYITYIYCIMEYILYNIIEKHRLFIVKFSWNISEVNLSFVYESKNINDTYKIHIFF